MEWYIPEVPKAEAEAEAEADRGSDWEWESEAEPERESDWEWAPEEPEDTRPEAERGSEPEPGAALDRHPPSPRQREIRSRPDKRCILAVELGRRPDLRRTDHHCNPTFRQWREGYILGLLLSHPRSSPVAHPCNP